MNRKIVFFVIILGILFILLGLIDIFINNSKDKNIQNNYVVINTKDKTGDNIDNSKYVIHYNFDLEKSYIKDNDISRKNVYNFYYPKELKQSYLTEYSRIYENNSMRVSAQIISERTIDEYEEYIIDLYRDNYDKLALFQSKDNINISGYQAEYLKLEALKEITDSDPIYVECFVLIIKISDSDFFALEYKVNFGVIKDELLTELVNRITIEENNAKYLYSNIEENKIVGVLQQNRLNQYDTGYKLFYTLNSEKYKEIEDARNTISTTTFETTDGKATINIQLLEEETVNIFDLLKTYIMLDYYEDDSYVTSNLKETKITLNDKEYFAYEFTYSENNSTDKKYFLQIVDRIDENYIYLVTINSNQNINNDMYEEFLNYKIENY